MNELKDYRFFEYPFTKATNLPKDIEKFWDKYFDDFVRLEDYDEYKGEDNAADYIQFVENSSSPNLLKLNEDYVKKCRERQEALRRRQKNILKYNFEISRLKKDDKIIMESYDKNYFEFLENHMNEF